MLSSKAAPEGIKVVASCLAPGALAVPELTQHIDSFWVSASVEPRISRPANHFGHAAPRKWALSANNMALLRHSAARYPILVGLRAITPGVDATGGDLNAAIKGGEISANLLRVARYRSGLRATTTP
jgi:hypothetical protein